MELTIEENKKTELEELRSYKEYAEQTIALNELYKKMIMIIADNTKHPLLIRSEVKEVAENILKLLD